MADKYIGIDGGGTKTMGVLFNHDGSEQMRIIKGYANFSVNQATSMANIEACLDTLTTAINQDDSLRHIQLGIAGLSAFKDTDTYVASLSERYGSSVDLVSDAVLALHSVKRSADQGVIMIVSGTGSVVMADEAGETTVIGGYGHLLGEEGSGYHLSIQALKKVINEQESNAPISSFSRRLSTHLSLKRREDLIQFVYRRNKQDIARLSLYIAEEAQTGDPVARELFEEEGRHLGRQTLSAYKKLKAKKPPIIALRGEFLMKAPFVKTTLLTYLKAHIEHFMIDDEPVEPVFGAYYLSQLKLAKR